MPVPLYALHAESLPNTGERPQSVFDATIDAAANLSLILLIEEMAKRPALQVSITSLRSWTFACEIWTPWVLAAP